MKTDALGSIVHGRNIKYKVTFPLQHTIPKLIKILYNDQLICSGTPEPENVKTIKLEHILRTQSGTETPVFMSSTEISTISTTSDFLTTDSTGKTVKPMKNGSLDDLLQQLYGSDSEFVQKSSPLTTQTKER